MERDYKIAVVDVALSTAAAPTYFPRHRSSAGTPLIDGGMWANNPVGIAMVEAIGVLGWSKEELAVLSVGTTTPLDIRAGRFRDLGWLYWGAGTKLVEVFMAAQSSAALGMAKHLIGDRSNLVRICPSLSRSFTLDNVSEIPSLKGLGDSEARTALATLRPLFFTDRADPFTPEY